MSRGAQDDYDYWVVVISYAAGPELLGPFTKEQLVTRLRDLYGTPVQVFPFRGINLSISSGPFRFLLTPEGETFPLFDTPEPKDVDPYGHLYDPAGDPSDVEDDDPNDNDTFSAN
jgi:hypothetical protein